MIEKLIEGELIIHRIEQDDEYNPFLEEEDEVRPPYEKKETYTQKNCQFYLATNVECLHDDYKGWNFTLSTDLILDIIPNYSQADLNLKMTHGLENRVIGSKIDAINAAEDKNWEKGGKINAKKNKKKKKHKGPEVNVKNILGGEDGLLAEEFHAEKWADEKTEAQRKFDERKQEAHFLMADHSNFELNLSSVVEEVPHFETKEGNSLWIPKHIEKIPKGGNEALKIEDCLESYFTTRLINNQEHNYNCEQCREDPDVDMENDIRFLTKYYRLYSAPQHFTITLKRFKHVSSYGGASFEKNDTQVNYGAILDLTKYFISKI